MEPPSMDTIYQAISALYENPNAAEKEKASIWLGDVQKSIHSWKIADQLLQEKKTIHSCYFAAQTMRSKVQHSLSELPQESLVSLRDSLVTHLEGTSPETSGAILTQLSLALVDLALQMPTWENFISDLIKSFANKNDFALLEVLTVLPQEIDSTSLKLGENRREEVKAQLRSNAPIVTNFLKGSISSSQASNVALKIMKCMTSWIQVKSINIQEIPQNAVIGYCLQVLRDNSSINLLHDAAADCICALLHCLEENNNNDNIERLLFESISSLEESYHMAVAHEEEEKAANYARVFTELAETFLEKIVSSTASGNTHFAMRSLELALVCVGHHDYEVAEITFNLWYRLSEETYQRDYQPLTDAFKPHIERLIEGLARHCQYEPDNTQLPDEGDEFYEFRMKVMELVKDVVFMVGSSAVFRQMFAALHADMSWEQTEAALFLMQAVASNIVPDEYEYVPKVVEAILSMPGAAHPAVRKTCLLLLGELAEWVERHAACLEPCLQCLLQALQDEDLALAAATAIHKISVACRSGGGTAARSLVAAAAAGAALPLGAPPATALARALAAALGALPHQQVGVGGHARGGVAAGVPAGGAGARGAAAGEALRLRPRAVAGPRGRAVPRRAGHAAPRRGPPLPARATGRLRHHPQRHTEIPGGRARDGAHVPLPAVLPALRVLARGAAPPAAGRVARGAVLGAPALVRAVPGVHPGGRAGGGARERAGAGGAAAGAHAARLPPAAGAGRAAGQPGHRRRFVPTVHPFPAAHPAAVPVLARGGGGGPLRVPGGAARPPRRVRLRHEVPVRPGARRQQQRQARPNHRISEYVAYEYGGGPHLFFVRGVGPISTPLHVARCRRGAGGGGVLEPRAGVAVGVQRGGEAARGQTRRAHRHAAVDLLQTTHQFGKMQRNHENTEGLRQALSIKTTKT